MHVGLMGTEKKCQSLLPSFSSACKVLQIKENDFNQVDLIIDLDFDDHQDFDKYQRAEDTPLILASVKCSLRQALYLNDNPRNENIFGLNALDGFLTLDKKEVSALKKSEVNILEDLMKKLGWNYEIVDDRIGMVAPRVLFMIINEAFYTVQEGTSTPEDIDKGMKLGTNYPFGPFEWVAKNGVKDVYETLEALFDDTKEDRYKICPMLKQAYLQSETT